MRKSIEVHFKVKRFMQEKRDYYEVLEVSRSAGHAEIKKAFLKKARRMHPDVSNDEDAESKFKELNEAYSVLSDERKRANYDRFGTAEGMGFGGFAADDLFSGMGFPDIFSDLFGGGGTSFRQRRRRPAPTRDEDLRIQMNVSIAEALKGKAETVEIPQYVECDACKGTGSKSQKAPQACPTCRGMGQVRAQTHSPFGVMEVQTPCPECGGEGTVIADPCEKCAGAGILQKTRIIKVTVSGEDLSKTEAESDTEPSAESA